jgi:hypothetical protein
MGREECGLEVAKQFVERPGQSLPTRHENIVIAGQAIKRKKPSGCGFQPAARPVPGDRIADLPARGEADPYAAPGALQRGAELDGQPARDPPDAARGAQEFRPFFQTRDRRFRILALRPGISGNRQADNFFRPWARRRARTLRPPTVAMRARKPCRRLRTILLG